MARKPSGATMLLSLFRTSEAIERVARKSTSGIGMCHSDFVLLQDLLHAGAQTPGAIGAKVGLTSGSVTAALDRLERSSSRHTKHTHATWSACSQTR